MPPPGFTPNSIHAHELTAPVYEALEQAARVGRKPQSGMWKRFQTAVGMLRHDGQWGEVIPPDDVPEYFRARYHATNLYCIDLSPTTRCFYMVADREVIFLDIVDHEEYDKWFPPKGRRKRR